ncbi:MAG: hypothetical protein PVG66_09775 [Chromatiales bacterium]|jgi:hypothetical protein
MKRSNRKFGQMFYRSGLIMLSLLGLFASAHLQAAVTSATGASSTKVLYANRNNTVTVRWHVTTTTDRRSLIATVPNTVPPVTLAGGITLTSDYTTESFSISGTQVQTWLNAGYQTIIIRRNFIDGVGAPVGGINADVRLSLSSSSLTAIRESKEFVVQRLQLLFPNQASMTVVEPGERLQAQLNVSYSGQGVLEGVWQIAEPGSTEGLPNYRNLMQVHQNLTSSQFSRLLSPRLPTDKSGRYLLRFCTIDRDLDQARVADNFSCPDAAGRVVVAYQVMAARTAKAESIEIAPLQSKIDAATEFQWSAVDGAVVYQLQIFQKTAQQDEVFISGMLLPQQSTHTKLSKLVLGKLIAGQQYLWRLNALNSNGQVVGQSATAFIQYSTE